MCPSTKAMNAKPLTAINIFRAMVERTARPSLTRSVVATNGHATRCAAAPHESGRV